MAWCDPISIRCDDQMRACFTRMPLMIHGVLHVLITCKQAFIILRTLIGLRLDQGERSLAAPVLTIPVSR